MDILTGPTAAGEADRPVPASRRQSSAPAGHETAPDPLLAGADETDPTESHIVRGID
ncbi:hypothetical protein RKD27_001076 [Streptomyces sp. SAI-126]|nr:hypothetical protein [Streptomyces sp. SAI-119]MDH6494556.1 hypothetical protein [Streptomyces sp. SAI-149]